MQRIVLLLLTATLSSAVAAQVIFTSSGPFVVPAGVDTVTFELVGAGGNGAANGGGGGGGGGYARRTSAVTPGTSYSIVVGAGGSELATIVGGLGVFANAGMNATTVPHPNVGGGGAGGTGVGGQSNRTGGTGGGGYWTYFGGGGGGAAGSLVNGGPGGNTIVWTGDCLTPGGAAGIGGGSPAGDGGKGAGFTDMNCTVTDPGAGGSPYGGGGGGGNGIGSPAGIGGGGVCIITWTGMTQVAEVGVDEDPVLLENPFSDRIVLRGISGDERFELLDATGKRIWAGDDIAGRDFSGSRPGTYFLRIVDPDGVRTIKALKRAQ